MPAPLILKRRPEIERFLAAPPKDIRVAVIHGRDLSMVRERGSALAARVTARPDDPFDVALLTETDIDAEPARLEEELSAISMMGGRRLVRLRLADERVGPDRAAAEALADHVAGKLSPDAFFLVESGALGRGSALRRAAERAEACVVIECWEDEVGDLARFTREALAADKLGLTSEAMELFVSRLPHERGVARQEIERLALFLGPGSGTQAGAADLVDFLGVEPEASIFEAASDAFGGKPAAVQAHLRRAAREGQGGPAAVRALGIHLAQLRQVRVLHAAGASLQQAVKTARVFWKQEREFQRQVRVWGDAEIDRAQADILAADIACKQTGSPDDLIAERLALSIAERARRMA